MRWQTYKEYVLWCCKHKRWPTLTDEEKKICQENYEATSLSHRYQEALERIKQLEGQLKAR